MVLVQTARGARGRALEHLRPRANLATQLRGLVPRALRGAHCRAVGIARLHRGAGGVLALAGLFATATEDGTRHGGFGFNKYK